MLFSIESINIIKKDYKDICNLVESISNDIDSMDQGSADYLDAKEKLAILEEDKRVAAKKMLEIENLLPEYLECP